VSGIKTSRWTKGGGILLLCLVSLGGASRSDPGRQLFCSAHEFLNYYRALEEANGRSGFFDRVALSLVLTSGECHPQKPASL
jgi:hypothetical protein